MQDFKKRYKQFAIDTGERIQQMPKSVTYVNQLIRCSSSPGTNYRAACREKSMADFINKLKIVEEELDESMYFFEHLHHFNPDLRAPIDKLIRESEELLSITVSSIKSARTKPRSS